MDLLKQLNDAMAYIEENLCGEVDLEKAAKTACLSKDSFLRFFSYMVGMTAAEYVRRRKLTLAAEELRHTKARILDVALQYGYESADAFSRAFAKQHGVTPAKFRKKAVPLKIVPPASFHIIIKGAKEMNFRLLDGKEIEVYGISQEFDRQEFPTREALRSNLWDEKAADIPGRLCAGRWNQLGNRAYDGEWYGLWRNGRYFIGRERDLVKDAGPLERQIIPAGEYAVFTSEKGGYAGNEIPKLFELVFDSWLPSSGYELRNRDIIEIYHLWTDKKKRKENRYYEILVPVNKK